MEQGQNRTQELFDFIENSPTAYQAVEELERRFEKAGYECLKETEHWEIRRGGRYYVVRNDSSLLAFAIPAKEIQGFHIVASHSDSPTFKIKEDAEMKVEDAYVRLNTEKYGGMILNTWMDRPLSIAGRVAAQIDGKVVSRNVTVDQDLLVIPNLAIHMNRDANKGVELNPQQDMLPLFSGAGTDTSLTEIVAKACGLEPEQILAHDLFLYVRQSGRIAGAKGEFILSPRLDDLQCVFASATAMMSCDAGDHINMCAVFDNEEVGSSTRQGADSTFLEDVLVRIREGLGQSEEWLRRLIADSFLISADNAHALHPNQVSKADPVNRPVLNGGVVLKYHGNQKYTTDALSAAMLKVLAKRAEVPLQVYTNRSDIAGGSTLGNISMRHISIPSADIGLPQLAMHSAVETAGARDTEYLIRLLQEFYSA
ncbi:MAG: M18 family aminopeptidase [Lachnospiraceae bacterium]|jgi:aspartyl aminopeptidase|nr:M18 family aminopeptidase [Lachnospiraceae bacterium]